MKLIPGYYGSNDEEKIVIRGNYEIDGDSAYKWLKKNKFKKIHEEDDGEFFVMKSGSLIAKWRLASDNGGYIKITKTKN